MSMSWKPINIYHDSVNCYDPTLLLSQLAIQLLTLSPTNIWYLFMDLKSMEDAHQQLREFQKTISASAMAQVC